MTRTTKKPVKRVSKPAKRPAKAVRMGVSRPPQRRTNYSIRKADQGRVQRAAGRLAGVARVRPLDQSRVRMRTMGVNFGALVSFAQGRSFSLSDVPAMLEDDQVSLCLGYLKIPIQQATVMLTVAGPRGQEAKGFVDELHNRVWNRLVSKSDLLMTYGYCCFEPLYRKDASDSRYWDFVDFDIAPPMASVPWVTNDRIAFAAIHQTDYGLGFSGYWDQMQSLDGCAILEGAGKYRPSKALWLANEPLLSRWFGRPVLKAAHYRWKMKTMPDGLLENMAKANYKAAFSGILIRYPANQSVVLADGSIMTSEEYADLMCQVIKTGSCIRLPSVIEGEAGWEIEEYAKNLVEMQQLIAPLDYADRGICRGMGIPDELLTHQGNTGGYSRSEISMGMYTAKGETRASDWLPACIEYVYNPLVRQRFGGDCEVRGEVVPQSLMANQQGDANGDGQPDALEGMDGQDQGQGQQGGGFGGRQQNGRPQVMNGQQRQLPGRQGQNGRPQQSRFGAVLKRIGA